MKYNYIEVLVMLTVTFTFSSATSNSCEEFRRRATEDPQTLTSPNFPLVYPKNTTCTWWISSSYFDSDIFIEFKHMDIEDSSDCVNDSLTIYQQYRGEEMVAKLCGNDKSQNKLELDGDVIIVFKTNNAIEETGFSLQYRVVYDDSRERDGDSSERYSDHWFTAVLVTFVLILVALIITIAVACYCQRRQSRDRKQSNIEDLQFSGYNSTYDECKTHI